MPACLTSVTFLLPTFLSGRALVPPQLPNESLGPSSISNTPACLSLLPLKRRGQKCPRAFIVGAEMQTFCFLTAIKKMWKSIVSHRSFQVQGHCSRAVKVKETTCDPYLSKHLVGEKKVIDFWWITTMPKQRYFPWGGLSCRWNKSNLMLSLEVVSPGTEDSCSILLNLNLSTAWVYSNTRY